MHTKYIITQTIYLRNIVGSLHFLSTQWPPIHGLIDIHSAPKTNASDACGVPAQIANIRIRNHSNLVQIFDEMSEKPNSPNCGYDRWLAWCVALMTDLPSIFLIVACRGVVASLAWPLHGTSDLCTHSNACAYECNNEALNCAIARFDWFDCATSAQDTIENSILVGWRTSFCR